MNAQHALRSFEAARELGRGLHVALHSYRERLDPAEDHDSSRTGLGTAPMAFCRNLRRSASAVSRVTSAPPTASEWPLMYFVVE